MFSVLWERVNVVNLCSFDPSSLAELSGVHIGGGQALGLISYADLLCFVDLAIWRQFVLDVCRSVMPGPFPGLRCDEGAWLAIGTRSAHNIDAER